MRRCVGAAYSVLVARRQVSRPWWQWVGSVGSSVCRPGRLCIEGATGRRRLGLLLGQAPQLSPFAARIPKLSCQPVRPPSLFLFAACSALLLLSSCRRAHSHHTPYTTHTIHTYHTHTPAHTHIPAHAPVLVASQRRASRPALTVHCALCTVHCIALLCPALSCPALLSCVAPFAASFEDPPLDLDSP